MTNDVFVMFIMGNVISLKTTYSVLRAMIDSSTHGDMSVECQSNAGGKTQIITIDIPLKSSQVHKCCAEGGAMMSCFIAVLFQNQIEVC